MNPLGSPNWREWFPQYQSPVELQPKLLERIARVLYHEPTNDGDRQTREMVCSVVAVIEIQARARLDELLFSTTPETTVKLRDETRALLDLLDLFGKPPTSEINPSSGGES